MGKEACGGRRSTKQRLSADGARDCRRQCRTIVRRNEQPGTSRAKKLILSIYFNSLSTVALNYFTKWPPDKCRESICLTAEAPFHEPSDGPASAPSMLHRQSPDATAIPKLSTANDDSGNNRIPLCCCKILWLLGGDPRRSQQAD
jgi:hypothetical protein